MFDETNGIAMLIVESIGIPISSATALPRNRENPSIIHVCHPLRRASSKSIWILNFHTPAQFFFCMLPLNNHVITLWNFPA